MTAGKVEYIPAKKKTRTHKRPGLSLSKSGQSGFITRQATKLMRDKMYEIAVEEE